jgi:hypothetical protein
MNIKNIIALEDVALDLKIAILDLRQNSKNISSFVLNRVDK